MLEREKLLEHTVHNLEDVVRRMSRLVQFVVITVSDDVNHEVSLVVVGELGEHDGGTSTGQNSETIGSGDLNLTSHYLRQASTIITPQIVKV